MRLYLYTGEKPSRAQGNPLHCWAALHSVPGVNCSKGYSRVINRLFTGN